MAQIIWSESSLDDLRAIYDYIFRDSKIYAQKMIDKIYERPSILSTQPYVGRIVPEYKIDSIRELFEGAYRIIYEIENENLVTILRIFHGARLLRPSL